MSAQLPVRKCVYCGEDKPRIYSGKKLKDGSKIYVNERAGRWAGRRCPDCERGRVNAAIHCDRFERDLILEQLVKQGYHPLSRTLPMKVEREGRIFDVEIRRAHMSDDSVVLDQAPKSTGKIFALVFNSVRIFDGDQLAKLDYGLKHYDGAVLTSPVNSLKVTGESPNPC